LKFAPSPRRASRVARKGVARAPQGVNRIYPHWMLDVIRVQACTFARILRIAHLPPVCQPQICIAFTNN
jgi:hypothetical protein